MKKSLYCVCIVVFVLALCTGFVIHASAAEQVSSYFTRYSATLFAGGRGAVKITISIVANRRVSELGTSYILLGESDDGGRTWSTAKEHGGGDWMATENRSSYSRTLSHQKTIRHQYRITVDVFAEDEDGGDSRVTLTSAAITAKR